jgi:hypothetical protein
MTFHGKFLCEMKGTKDDHYSTNTCQTEAKSDRPLPADPAAEPDCLVPQPRRQQILGYTGPSAE